MAHGHGFKKTPVIILASASPRRRMLLRVLGVPFRVRVARVDELDDDRMSPPRLVTANARLKAEAIAARVRQGIIIGADTVVVLGSRRFGKPRDARHAKAMLRSLSGRTHRVYTGICVIDQDRRRRFVDVACTRVTMRRLSAAQIDRYVRGQAPWDKAGAYAVQDVHGMLIDRVRGSLSNVVGLPLEIVERRLRQCGIRL